MKTRTLSFDDIPMPTLELDCQYSYCFNAGKHDGPMENCFPAGEESEIILEKNWQEKVRDHYVRAALLAIKEIESRVMDMEFDNLPAQWNEESA